MRAAVLSRRRFSASPTPRAGRARAQVLLRVRRAGSAGRTCTSSMANCRLSATRSFRGIRSSANWWVRGPRRGLVDRRHGWDVPVLPAAGWRTSAMRLRSPGTRSTAAMRSTRGAGGFRLPAAGRARRPARRAAAVRRNHRVPEPACGRGRAGRAGRAVRLWRIGAPGDRGAAGVGVRGLRVDARAAHRKLAESLGAVWVGSETERPPVALDRAVTFAPSGDVVVAALASLRKGGVVAINAIHLDRMPEFDYDRLLWGERQIRSVANMTRVDARDFLALRPRSACGPR